MSLLHQFTSCMHALCTLHARTVHAARTHCARCTHAWCTLHARIVHTARTHCARCTHAPTVHTARTHCAHCTHAPTVHAAHTHCARCTHASCTLHVRVFAIWEAFKVCGVPDPQDPMVWQVVAWEEAGCCVLGPRKKRVAFQRMNLKSRSVTRTFCSMSICKALWRGQAIPPRHGGRAEDADAPHCNQPHVWLSM